MDERQARVRSSKRRIDLHRPLKQIQRRTVIDAIEAIQMLQAEMICGPSIEIFDCGEARARCFVQRNPDLQRHQHLGSDLLAHRMHIVDPPREAFGPDDCVIAGVHQVDEDDELVT